MIQTRPATTVHRVGPVAAIVLVAGLTVGFVAGQAAPDLLGGLMASGASVESVVQPPALTRADDYGTRHPNTAPLTRADDYGTRHSNTAPLTRADDYGTRHADQP